MGRHHFPYILNLLLSTIFYTAFCLIRLCSVDNQLQPCVEATDLLLRRRVPEQRPSGHLLKEMIMTFPLENNKPAVSP